MMRTLALLVVAGGCTVGFGHAYVGKKAERRFVEQYVCIENDQGQCGSKRELKEHYPAERFRGFTLGMQMGAMQLTTGDRTYGGARGELLGEYISGHGRLAWSLRGSATIEGTVEEAASSFQNSWSLLGHLGLPPHFELYCGAGIIPYAHIVYRPSEREERGWGFRAIAGGRWVVFGNSETFRVLLSLEFDHTRIRVSDGYSSSGVTMNFGFYF